MAALDRAPGVDVPRSAYPIALDLRANGTTITGDLQIEKSEGAIECLSYVSSMSAATRAGSGVAGSAGRRVHDGITIRKAIDRATPLLARALCFGESIEATFRFFRESPYGDGSYEQFFTVEIDQARLTAITLVSPDGLSNPGDTPRAPAFEDVQFTFGRIIWRYEPDSIEFEDVSNARL
jgi:type VI secretion system secreted protein Hcp